MRYYKKIVGENIYLSPINLEDYETYVSWMNNFNCTDCIGSSYKIINLLSEKEYIEQTLKEQKYQFAIVKLDNDKLIGNCGFYELNNISRSSQIGIFIGDEENRDKGYGKEAINLLLDYGFNYLNLNNIMLKVFSFNNRAINVYKNVGFKEIGARRKSYFLNGKYYDEVYMDIISEEFNKKFIKNK